MKKKWNLQLFLAYGQLYCLVMQAQSMDEPVHQETERFQGVCGSEIGKYLYLPLLYFAEV